MPKTFPTFKLLAIYMYVLVFRGVLPFLLFKCARCQMPVVEKVGNTILALFGPLLTEARITDQISFNQITIHLHAKSGVFNFLECIFFVCFEWPTKQ